METGFTKADNRNLPRVDMFMICNFFATSMSGLIAGTTLSWTSPCLGYYESLNTTAQFTITPEEGSWVGSLLAIGALIAAIPSGIVVDKFGRKNCLLSISIPYMISWVLIINAKNVWMLYIGRMIGGLGIGGTCTLVPMYLTEITEDVTRGPIGALFPLLFSAGVLLTFLVNIFAEYPLLTYILAGIPIIYGIFFLFMPETPIYLVKKSDDKAAKKSLEFLRGDRYDVNSELMDIKKDINTSVGDKASLLEILKDQIYLKSLIACIILFTFQQFSGINAVFFYTIPIFKASNSTLDPLLSSIIVASIQVFATILVIYIVDKLNRKTYLIISAAIMALCLFLLGLYFTLNNLKISFPFMDKLPLISLMVYILFFSIGFGPIPWIVVGEINTPEIVGTVSGIAMLVNWLCGFIVTKTFGPMLINFGADATFYAYSALNLIAIVLVYFFVPETRLKQQHEIFAKS